MHIALLLTIVVGVSLMVEGLTRQRQVSTLASRSIAHVAAAFLGFTAVGYGLAFGDGSVFAGTEWFGLSGVELDNILGGAQQSHADRLAIHAAAAAVFASVSCAAFAERGRVIAHVMAGTAVGAVLYPLLVRAVWNDGVVSRLRVDSGAFVDDGAAATLAAAAGVFGLVGTVFAGPRLGKYGSSGQVRVIPGWAPSLAVVGALVVLAGWTGVASGVLANPPEESMSTSLFALISGTSGALSAIGASVIRGGQTSAVAASRGLVGAMVAGSALPASVGFAEAVGCGVAIGVLMTVVGALFDLSKVDDPIGVTSMFGVAGLAGSVIGALVGGHGLVAELLGLAVIVGASVVTGLVVFGGLSLLKRLRITEEIELVGLF